MDKKLLEKFFLGKCTSKEKAEVVAWLETMKGDLYDLSAIEAAWNKFEVSENDRLSWDSQEVLQKILKQIDHDAVKGKHVLLPHISPKKDKIEIVEDKENHEWLTKLVVAASIGLIMAVSFFFYGRQDTKQDLISDQSISTPTITKSTTNGQRLNFKLSDGTRVKLNSNSSIAFPESFTANKRQVKLSGEAFFEIAHDSLRPFEVLTGDLKTKVLGTSFNVKAYPEQERTRIALVEGKVRIYNTSETKLGVEVDSITLAPSEEMVFDKQVSRMDIYNLDEDQIAWRNGILVFKAASMKEIVQKLEGWYGVEIEYPQAKYSSLRFTGRFDNKSLKKVMDGIRLTANFDFELKGKKMKIK